MCLGIARIKNGLDPRRIPVQICCPDANSNLIEVLIEYWGVYEKLNSRKAEHLKIHLVKINRWKNEMQCK